MKLVIKAADSAEASVLAQIGAQTFYDTFRSFNSEEDMQSYILKAYSEDVILKNIEDKNIRYALISDEGKPIGYTKLLMNAKHEKLLGNNIELEKIYVLQDVIGTGVGKLLMDEAIVFCKQQQANNLFLGVWEENERAVNFYHKAGFEIFANRSFQLGLRLCEDYMMKLNIT